MQREKFRFLNSRPALAKNTFVLLASASLALADEKSLRVTNPIDLARPNESVTVPRSLIAELGPELLRGEFRLWDAMADAEVVCQKLDLDRNGEWEELVFQSDFGSRATKTFQFRKGPPARVAPKVFGRLVPERKDDFAWENDRIAFRMYGRKLEDELVSAGIDVWCKRTPELIINKWYASGDYHKDHGEGLDAYKVGEALGCGGTAILKDGRLYSSRNFVESRILADGPIRLVFELKYEPWEAGGVKVSEMKRITLDAGQNLNRFECRFSPEVARSNLTVAVGLQKHPGSRLLLKPGEGWMRLWEPADVRAAGHLGAGFVIHPHEGVEMSDTLGHALATLSPSGDGKVVFYTGAGWEQSGHFADAAAWDKYLADFARRAASPLKISLSTEKQP